MMEDKAELLTCLGEKIQSGKDMAERLKLLGALDGVDKLIRKIEQEVRFLEKVVLCQCTDDITVDHNQPFFIGMKVQLTKNVKKEHLQSTNLIHLDAVVARLLNSKEITSVMKPFKYQNSRLEVDIVCNSASWIKVIARNAKALTLISLGNGEYGQKSVVDQAYNYLNCAKLYPVRYRPPEVIFHFAYGIEIPLATRLERMGIIVEGDRIKASDPPDSNNGSPNVGLSRRILVEDSSDELESLSDSELEALNPPVYSSEINVLNLDVSTLLAYVTNMTNGHANFIYREPLLTRQAEWERKRPVKPILEQLFQDKDLIVCRTAYDNFMNIIDVIGGPDETARAHNFLRKVHIVDDVPTGRIIERLSLGGKIKERSRLVFATGENMKSITVSANEGFVRAARMQGIECTVFLHEPRSLSQIKESHAARID